MTGSLLTLGDSYTIGEGVPLYDSYPYQTVRMLRQTGLSFYPPEIVAKTGWTTDELERAMKDMELLPGYDFVTLLIGVNDEYRGRGPGEYRIGFEGLLRQAIALAGNRAERTFVISIPDWGISPFAAKHLPDDRGRDASFVAGEIDSFNAAAATIAGEHQVSFIDITAHSRLFGPELSKPAFASFAADGLHPSGGQYKYWAELLAGKIRGSLGAWSGPAAGQ